MLSQLSHKTLDLYTLSKKLVYCCYELTQDLPAEEKTQSLPLLKKCRLNGSCKCGPGRLPEKEKEETEIC
jgi:hypothetical protein